jgi:hypothetical protein
MILSNMQINHCTLAMMPSPQAREAPAKFTGKYEDVKQFLKRYNNLCLAYNVDNGSEKCKQVLDYCSHKVIQVIPQRTKQPLRRTYCIIMMLIGKKPDTSLGTSLSLPKNGNIVQSRHSPSGRSINESLSPLEVGF